MATTEGERDEAIQARKVESFKGQKKLEQVLKEREALRWAVQEYQRFMEETVEKTV